MKRLKKVFDESLTPLLISLVFAIGLLLLLRRFRNTSLPKGKQSRQIFKILRKQGLEPQFSKLLIAQAIHETGNFQSRLFLQQNNAFGMKIPRIRKTLNVGQDPDGGFATFISLEDSVKDMLLYLDHFKIPLDIDDPFKYAKILKDKNYFEDDIENYFKGLQNGLSII